MWIEKLASGIIQLDTHIGPRYLQPNLLQRAYLIWTFRNFVSLPQQVLRPSERRMIDRLRSENRFVPLSIAGVHDRPIIGRVERPASLHTEVMPLREPLFSSPPNSKPAVGEHSQEADSA